MAKLIAARRTGSSRSSAHLRGVLIVLAIALVTGGGISCRQLSDGAESALERASKAIGSVVRKVDNVAPPGAITGKITTGSKVSLGSRTMKPSGAIWEVDRPGDPLNGLTIDVPTGAFQNNRDFRLSYAPIAGHTFGRGFRPLSPLITVDSGGYAREYMRVTIPVQVPSGQFAMGFLYDGKNGTLDALPLVKRTATSVTVATMHFSDLVVLSVDESTLAEGFKTAFAVGQDSWSFPNAGTYYQPTGLCNGMSLTAVWYFLHRKGLNEAPLYSRFDNNERRDKTPQRWEDDSWGYRFASMAQLYAKPEVAGDSSELEKNDISLRDEISFALKTGKPQVVGLTHPQGYAHAIVAYGVTPEGNIMVYDPNRPADSDAILEYRDGKMITYNAGLSEGGQDIPFDRAYLVGNQDANWDKIGDEFDKVLNRTIGNDGFPEYQLVYKDEDGKSKTLKDGLIVSESKIWVDSSSKEATTVLRTFSGETEIARDKDGYLTLKTGRNEIGFLVEGQTDLTYDDGSKVRMPIDFVYRNVTFSAVRIDPPAATLEIKQEQLFKAVMDNPPAGVKYKWTVKARPGSAGGDSYRAVFDKEGTYEITVDATDAEGKDLGSARATATVKPAPKPASGQLAKLQKAKKVAAIVQADCSFADGDQSSGMYGSFGSSGSVNGKLKWNGASFVLREDDASLGSYVGLAGTVSADGKTLVSLSFDRRLIRSGSSVVNNITESFRIGNIPIKEDKNSYGGTVFGPAAKTNLMEIKHEWDHGSSKSVLKSCTFDDSLNHFISIAFVP